MFKQTISFLLLTAIMPMLAHAGQGTIRETENAIIIEYSGEGDEDVKATKIIKEREDKQHEVDVVKQTTIAEQANARSALKSAAKAAERAARKARGEEEGE